MANPNLEITLPSGQKQIIGGTDPNYDIYVKQGAKPVAEPTLSITPTTNVPIRYPTETTTETTDEYGNILKSRTTGQKTDAEIQAEERNRIQGQIDALENYWSSTIAPELQREGEQRLGETRAIGASVGLMGTPMGQAQKEKTTAYNTQLTRAERAKIDAQISDLYSKADERAIDRAEKQATLLRTDQEAYQNYLKGQTEEARGDLETMFKGGITLDQLKADPEKYKQLLENAGIKDDFMAEAIYNANAPTEAKKDIKYQTVGNKVIGYYYDNATGGIKTIESEEIPGLGGGSYKTQVAGGTMLLIPENIDPDKPLDEQILQYGKTGQFKATSGSSSSTGSSSTDKETKTFESDKNDVVKKLASGDMDWGTAYETMLNLYESSNPELFEQVSPEEILARGGDPNIDKTYMDILLSKKRYVS